MTHQRSSPRSTSWREEDVKPFWLVSLVQTIVLFVLGYLIAVFSSAMITLVAAQPQGPFWDEALRPPFTFGLTVFVTIVLGVPYFQRDNDPTIRTLSVFSSTLLIGYLLARVSGLFDPDVPLVFVMRTVVMPLRHHFGLV